MCLYARVMHPLLRLMQSLVKKNFLPNKLQLFFKQSKVLMTGIARGVATNCIGNDLLCLFFSVDSFDFNLDH